MKMSRIIGVALIASMLAGCAGQYGQKQAGGAIIGGTLGGLLGSQIGGGTGKLAATAGLAVLGLIIGSEAGKSLDRADQLAMGNATYRALETSPVGGSVEWRNPDYSRRTYGYVVPTRTYRNPHNPQMYCREYQQTVIIGGQAQDAYGKACRQPDGSWRIVNDQSSMVEPVIIEDDAIITHPYDPYRRAPVIFIPGNQSAGYRARVRYERATNYHRSHWWH